MCWQNEKERELNSLKRERIVAGKVDVGTENVIKHVLTNAYAALVTFMSFNRKALKRSFTKELGIYNWTSRT